ncbi:hypothetical protein TD95_002081 [Thielaviopsis punctulata]|uniref:Uncharacterized protein n=1 Tax=Thielaviopsis punctulata TaxID=72032 RepID=A0A0F4ZJV9_9PEZI|nr:hypothetical protein TD95_002081 [Thielaviopsis punctulata]
MALRNSKVSIAFSYFEKLAEIGDCMLVHQEVARLRDYNEMLSAVGYNSIFFEDMAQETFNLLTEMASCISSLTAAMTLITSAFNNRDRADAILYHMRLITATSIKGNPEYEPFTEGLGVVAYCSQVIEVPGREIEHIAIDALATVLLKPLNMVLQIVCLDRTKGSQCNTHQIPADVDLHQAETSNRAIYLLFRPGHYDVLYRPFVDIQIHKTTVSFHVEDRFESTPGGIDSFPTFDFTPFAHIPGFSDMPGALMSGGAGSMGPGFMSLGGNLWDGPQISQPSKPRISPVSVQPSPVQMPLPCSVPVSVPQTPQPVPTPALQLRLSQQVQVVPPPSPPVSTPVSESFPPPKMPAVRKSEPSQASQPPPQNQQYQLRFCKHVYSLEHTYHRSQPIQHYKGSHFNKAHFKNPKFQPEQWTPRDYYDDDSPSSERERKIVI